MKEKNPCFNCNDRNATCHANCIRYEDWKQKEYARQQEIDKIKRPHKLADADEFHRMKTVRKRYAKR